MGHKRISQQRESVNKRISRNERGVRFLNAPIFCTIEKGNKKQNNNNNLTTTTTKKNN